MKVSEAHDLLTALLTTRDQKGNPFIAPEVDMGECRELLDDVIAKEVEKGEQGVRDYSSAITAVYPIEFLTALCCRFVDAHVCTPRQI